MSASIRSSVRRFRSISGFATRAVVRRLGEFFGRRPVILALVYYRCPLLCNQVFTGLTRSLKPLSQSAGTRLRRGGRELQSRGIVRTRVAEKRPTWNSMIGRGRRGAGISWSAIPRADRAALPDRRVPVPVQSRDQALRPRRGDRDPDARRTRCTVLLRDRVPFQGSPERTRTRGERPDRLADRSPALVLLRLRRGDRQVHAVDRPDHPRTGIADSPCPGLVLGVMFWRDRRGRPVDRALRSGSGRIGCARDQS